MFRLFVGIPLPAPVRDRLGGLCSGLPGARWVAPECMHVTLRFIGEVGGRDAEDVHDALARIRSSAFALTVAGIGCFESGRKVRTLWAGIAKEERLSRLHEKVETAVVRAGLEPDRRKFKAHVTLARFKNGGSPRIGPFIESNNTFATAPFAVDHFTLFRSFLGREGPHYEALADYPLDRQKSADAPAGAAADYS